MKKQIIILFMMCFSWVAALAAPIDDTTSVYGKAILPSAIISGGYYNICSGSSADIPVYLSNATVYDITFTDGVNTWTITGITGSVYHLIVTPPMVRYYNILSVIGDGCSGTFSGTAVVTPLAAPSIYTLSCATTSFCPGSTSGSFTLNGSSSTNGEVYWLSYVGDTMPIAGTTTIGTGGILTFPGIGTPGTVYAIAENSAGCQSIMNGTITLTQNPLPGSATIINGPSSICENTIGVTYSIPSAIPNATSYVWSVPVGSTITWNGGTSIIVDMGGNSGNVSVSGINSCGGGPAIVLPITVNPAPNVTINASPSTTICNGDDVDLTATSDQFGSTFAWSTGQTGPTITVAPVANTMYTVTVTNPTTGCTESANITITVNTVPTPLITMPNSVCLQEHVPLSATPAGGTWTSLGVGGDTLYTEICGAGAHLLTYTVTAGGCSATDEFYITVNPLPYVTWTTVPGPFTTATPPLDLAPYVDPTPGSGLGWSFNGPTGSFIGSVFDASVAGPGTHLLIYTFTHLNGCSNDAGVYVTVNTVGIDDVEAIKNISMYPNPASDQLNLDGIDTQEITALNIMNAFGQIVYTTSTTSTMRLQVSELAAGTYFITFTNANGIYVGKKIFVKQ